MATTNLTNLKANALTNVVSTIISTSNIIASSGPKISSITYPGDDTAASTSGGQTVTLTGSGFNSGASVLINGEYAGVVTVVSSTSITFTAPANSGGTYALYVINTDGGTAILVPGISYSGTPAWSNTAGSLATLYETANVSSQLTATGDTPVTYSLHSGTLPPGSSLNTSTGLLSGTSEVVASSTTYNFVIRATDAENQDTDRSFSITINPDVVTWSSPTDNSTVTGYEYAAISPVTLDATSAAGKSITYTANTLPSGVTISGNTISGTPTAVANTNSLLTANAASTFKTATRNINFVVNQDVVTWNSPADGSTTSLSVDAVMSNVPLSASSAAGQSVSYTANALPTGVTISGSNVTGTPTVVGTTTSVITATAATTNRTATRTFYWVVNVTGDTYFKNTTLLLNGETTNNVFIKDASTNDYALTIVGDTKPVPFNPYTPGYYSAYFDGTSDSLVINGNAGPIGTEDFTWECWAYISTMGGDYPRIFESNTGVTGSLQIYLSNGTLTIGGNGTGTITSYSISALKDQWLHLCVTRTGSSMRLFVNGVLRGYSASGGNNFASGGSAWRTLNEGGGIIGYLSNMRVVRGSIVSAYSTSNTTTGTTIFTPPTSPLTAISGTQFLGMQSNRFIDNSTNAFSFTVSGDTAVKAVNPFTANSSYSTYSSAYFDSTGDNLVTPTGTIGTFGTSPFTIEFWMYSVDAASVLIRQDASGTPNWALLITSGNIYWQNGYEASSLYYLALSSLTTNPLVSAWTHVAITRNSSNQLKFWINGIGQTPYEGDSTNYNTTSAIRIGQGSYGEYSTSYLSDVRIVKGTAVYTSNFTPPTSPLTAVANTSLLTLQYNGGATNQAIIDNSDFNNIITRNGNTSQGSFSPYNATGWSNYFDGTGDYLSVPSSAAFQFGTGDFTIESWILPNDLSSNNTNNFFNLGTYLTGILMRTTSAGGVQLYITGTSKIPVQGGLTVKAWNHVALVRSGTTCTLYINGTVNYSFSDSTNISPATANPIIGMAAHNSSEFFNGYISNVRVVKGTAVYTSAFTPPTSPLTAISGTSLLTCQSNRVIDNSTNAFTITKNGDLSVQAFDPFGSVPEAVPISYSNYFDGNGDFLTVGSSTNLALGAANWTVEGWIYPTSVSISQNIIADWRSTNNTLPVLYMINNQVVWRESSATKITSSTTLNVNTWYHVAVVKASTTTTMYINGVSVGSYTDNTNYSNSDFKIGKAWDTNYWNGYISNLRIVIGTAVYTSTFTPPTTPLTAISGTSLLTCQSTTMIDNSTNAFTITPNGNTVPSRINPFGYTTQSATSYTPSLHGGSAYFDGTGDYLQINHPTIFDQESNFTVEMWLYVLNYPGSNDAKVYHPNGAASGTGLLAIAISTVGKINIDDQQTGNKIVSTATVLKNVWTHVALVRNGPTTNNLTLYINGVADTTTSYTGWTSIATQVEIGRRSDTATYYNGYISDLRLTKGVAVYTGNFVPPSQTLTSYSATYPASLLLNFNSAGVVDQHGSNVLETVGNTQLSTSVKKYNNSSIYFDGTGDYCLAPFNALHNFGTGDFTIEAWIYRTDTGVQRGIVDTAGSSGVRLLFYITAANKLTLFDGTNVWLTSADTIPSNQWVHVAVTRASGTTRLFIDGTLQVANADARNYVSGSSGLYIGRQFGSTTSDFRGYIDDLRITNGFARYTSAFTPPAAALETR